MSQLREDIVNFDDIEKKILEKRNEIKDLEKILIIAEYSARLLLRKKRKLLEKVDESKDVEEDKKRFSAALVCNANEFDVDEQ